MLCCYETRYAFPSLPDVRDLLTCGMQVTERLSDGCHNMSRYERSSRRGDHGREENISWQNVVYDGRSFTQDCFSCFSLARNWMDLWVYHEVPLLNRPALHVCTQHSSAKSRNSFSLSISPRICMCSRKRMARTGEFWVGRMWGLGLQAQCIKDTDSRYTFYYAADLTYVHMNPRIQCYNRYGQVSSRCQTAIWDSRAEPIRRHMPWPRDLIPTNISSLVDLLSRATNFTRSNILPACTTD